jgi:hypothetical protein
MQFTKLSGWIPIISRRSHNPTCRIGFRGPDYIARHDVMARLVDHMLALQKRLPQARTQHEQTALARHIAAKGRQIDALVYELYGLTGEEIGIVEGRR